MITVLKIVILGVLAQALSATQLHAEESLIFTNIGSLKSRVVILTVDKNAPTIYMIPGSGAIGPESMMPKGMTLDDQSHPLFIELGRELAKIGYNSVMIGKPGVDFAKPGVVSTFYDQDLYNKLTWTQYLKNIEEVIGETQLKFSTNSKKYLLGHSEGTLVAQYLAERKIHDYQGLILLGYLGRNMKKITYYQLVERFLENFKRLDKNQDSLLSRLEFKDYPEYEYFRKDYVTYEDVLKLGKGNYQAFVDYFSKITLWQESILDMPDSYDRSASLSIPLYVYQGELDTQTPVYEVQELKKSCDKLQKPNCYIYIIPKVGHGFSEPKGKRKDPFFDATIGPMNANFFEIIKSTLRFH